jgi:hypothetical protein
MDGVRDHVMIESSFDLPVYTVALWFKVEGGTGGRDLFSAYAMYDSVGSHGILLEITGNGTLRFLHRAPLGTAGGSDMNSGSVLDDGNWYHVAFVKSADSAKAYVNGELVGTVADDSEFGQALERIALGMLRHDTADDPRFFPGVMDEVYVYGRALSHAEVAYLAGRTAQFDAP